MKHSLAEHIATSFGVGYGPIAPGTWGSLVGLPLAALAHVGCAWVCGTPWNEGLNLWGGLLGTVAVLAPLALLVHWAITQTEAKWGQHDPSAIVADEVLGQMATSIWFAPHPAYLLCGFLLFRLFDIVKPGPVGRLDRELHTPLGTWADDFLGGLFAALALKGASAVFFTLWG